MATNTTTTAPTATQYIQNLVTRANATLVEINKLKIKKNKLTEELNIFNSQLLIKEDILTYTKKVENIVLNLIIEVKGVQSFFQTPDGALVTPAHIDLPPADRILPVILANAKEIAGLFYQSMVNVNYCLTRMATTANKLATALGAISDGDSDSAPGFIHFNQGPNDGLYNKMKNAVTAGLNTLQKLANTFLSFVQFLHMVEALYYEAKNVDGGLEYEVKNLDTFSQRNKTRISTESQYVSKLKDLVSKTNHHLEEVDSRLEAATVDHNMLIAEFNAANESLSPQKKVAPSSVKSK